MKLEPISGTRGAERRIYGMLRRQIEDGALAASAKLVSTRALAAELGVSRTTVTAAYEQLAAEGYIETSAGMAARVAGSMPAGLGLGQAGDTRRKTRDLRLVLSRYGQRVAALEPYAVASPLARIDFKYGAAASRDFPAQVWQRAYRAEVLKRPSSLQGQPDEDRLRKALQGYLRRARGLAIDADQVLVVHGSQQGLDLCARLLLNPGDAFVFEDPGYRMARFCFEATGAKALPMPVDASGLDTEGLSKARHARLAFVTPSHQFPMGGVLPVARRMELLGWASRQGAWIVEDDYGGEFRYGQRPVDALQSIDTDGRVIYAGTFSRALSPQLRLGFLVLPHVLIDVFREGKRLTDRHSARWDQNVLASLIENGTYERHVRRMRRENERRRKALMEAVERNFGGRVHLVGMAAGLHGVLLLPGFRPQDEPALQAAALEEGAGVYPLSPLFARRTAAASRRPAGLILGYAGLTLEEIREGVGMLGRSINPRR